jgi:NhaP-type Na+/H+ or K+/H+ antiporter
MTEQALLQILVVIFFVGILIQWVAWKFKFPGVVFLLAAGVILGPVLGHIPSTLASGHTVHALLKLALAIILFEGGLQLKFHELKNSGKIVKKMILLGASLHFAFLYFCNSVVLDLGPALSLIFASILIVTGPTVILPLLRQSRIPKRISSGLKWEAIIVDPIGAILTVLFFEYFTLYHENNSGLSYFLLAITKSIILAGGLGAAAGYFVKELEKRSQIPEHLKSPLVLTLVFVIYLLSDYVQTEAGLIATTVFGVILGNSKTPISQDLHKFKEPLTVILISLIFIVLAATLNLRDLANIFSSTNLLYLFLIIFIARPLAMYLALLGTGLRHRERLFLGWIGPRGVVAAAVVEVFAPKLMGQGYEQAGQLVPLIFAVIILTVIFHGFSLNPLARIFELNVQKKSGVLIVGANSWSHSFAQALIQEKLPVLVADNNWHSIQKSKMLSIPSFYGEVLANNSEELLDLTDISMVVATTENDSYNALVCKHFSSHIGRENVYQLPLHNFEMIKDKGLKSYLRGNVIISTNDIYEELEKNYYRGWTFKHTKLTEEFSLDNFESYKDTTTKLVALIRGEKDLIFNTVDIELKPRKGDTLISYGPEES